MESLLVVAALVVVVGVGVLAEVYRRRFALAGAITLHTASGKLASVTGGMSNTAISENAVKP